MILQNVYNDTCREMLLLSSNISIEVTYSIRKLNIIYLTETSIIINIFIRVHEELKNATRSENIKFSASVITQTLICSLINA